MRSALRLCLIPITGLVIACGGADTRLPEEVCGRWITDDPKYAGCFMEIDNEHLAFGNDDANLEIFRVVEVDREGQGADVRYTLTYIDASEQESTFTFEHLILRASIRVAHSPKRIWTKQRIAAPQPEPEPEPEPEKKPESAKPEPKSAAAPAHGKKNAN